MAHKVELDFPPELLAPASAAPTTARQLSHLITGTLSAVSSLNDHFAVKEPNSPAVQAAYFTAIHPMTPELQAQAVRQFADSLELLYVDKQRGKAMADLLKQNLDAGAYTHLISPIHFKERLLRDIRSVYPDEHFDIEYSPAPLPENTAEIGQFERNEKAQERARLKENHYGFAKAEVDPETGIGYVKLDLFAASEFPETFRAIDKTMRSVAHARELILDLRDNSGGDPNTVARIISHFVDEPTLVNEMYHRPDDRTDPFIARPLSNTYGADKPIYILIGPDTFSAAEEFAYNLQALNRATLIGQKTRGGAHAVWEVHLASHFIFTIPVMKAINPITGTNWEDGEKEKGVQPHIPLPADIDPLEVARNRILTNRSLQAAKMDLSRLVRLLTTSSDT